MVALSGKPKGPVTKGMYTSGADGTRDFVAEAVAIEVAAKREEPIDQTEEVINQGDYTFVDQSRQQDLAQAGVQALERSRMLGFEPYDAAKMLETANTKAQVVNEEQPGYSAADLGLTLDPNLSEVETQAIMRRRSFAIEMAEIVQDKNEGFFNKAFDFVSSFTVEVPWEAEKYFVSGSNEEWGRKLAIASRGSEEEWNAAKQGFRQYLEETGAFGDNFFLQMEAVSNIENEGFDPFAWLKGGVVAVDIATLGGGKLATAAAKGVLRSARPVRNAAKPITNATSELSIEAGEELAEKAVRSGSGSRRTVNEELVPDSFNPTMAADDVRIPEGRRADISAGNTTRQVVGKNRGILAGVSDNALTEISDGISTGFVRKTGRPLYSGTISTDTFAGKNYGDTTGYGNFVAVARFGNAEGQPMSRSSAYKFARGLKNEGNDADVVPIDIYDMDKGYVVQVLTPLKTEVATKGVDLDEAANVAFMGVIPRSLTDWAASTRTAGTTVSQARAIAGEGLRANLMNANPELKATLGKLKSAQWARVNEVMAIMRDGDEAAKWVTRWMTDEEFSSAYYARFGKEPEFAELQAYAAAKELSDDQWFLAAQVELNKANDAGLKTLDLGLNGTKPLGAPVGRTGLKESDRIYDATSRTNVNLDDLPPNVQLFKLDRPISDPAGGVNKYITHVVRAKKVRNPQPQDVLGYNPGGNRTYKDEFFGVADADVRGGQALFTAPSKALAEQGAKEIEEVVSAARAQGITDWAKAGPNAALDNLVERMSLIKNISTWDELVELAGKKGWRFPSKMGSKASHDVVDDFEGIGAMASGQRYDDFTRYNNARNNEVLLGWGGADAAVHNPIDSIQLTFRSVANEFSFQRATNIQMAEWLKTADPSWKPTPGTSTRAAFTGFDERKLAARGNKAAYLTRQRNIILRRMSQQGPVTQQISRGINNVFDSIAGKFGETGARRVNAVGNLLKTDNLLRVGFLSAFAFNTAQFMVQASWGLFIMAISPVAGSKALMNFAATRMALHSSWKSVDMPMLRGMAKVTGVTDKQFDAMVEFTRRTGRINIDGEAIELGSDLGQGATTWGGKALPGKEAVSAAVFGAQKFGQKAGKVGMIPFNEGERANRLMANNTAVLEWFAKNPNRKPSDLYDDLDVFDEVFRRADDLSANMTTASRGTWQTGYLRVPTQWLSHTMRVAEMATFGKQLTGWEKARLWTMILAVGGGAGFGAAGKGGADKLSEAFGLEPGGTAHKAIRKGVVDTILEEAWAGATGENLNLGIGERIAPMGAFYETWRKLNEENFFKVVGGPSAEIGGGGLVALMSSAYLIARGEPQLAWDGLERVLRTPTFIDNIAKAYGVTRTGIYQSKSGAMLQGLDLSVLETVLLAGGVGSGKVNEVYYRRGKNYSAQKEEAQYKKKYAQWKTEYYEALKQEDFDKAVQISQNMNTLLQISGLPWPAIQRIQAGGDPSLDSEWLKLVEQAIRNDDKFATETILRSR